MDYLNKDDLFKVAETSMIGKVDIEIVTKLYQPLMGYKSLSLYLTFLNLNHFNKFRKHEYIYNLMQITPNDFLLSRKTLEALGLLKSFKKDNNYIYQIYPPKSPNDFFNDYLFKGMMIKYLGEEITKELASSYKIDIDLKEYKEITTSFNDVFSLNLDDSSFSSSVLDNIQLKKNTSIEIIGKFSNDEFINRLKEKSSIEVTSIGKNEINEIIRIASLYGINLEEMVKLCEECFDSKKKIGNKIDLESLNKKAGDIANYSNSNIVDNNKKLVSISIGGKSKLADEIELITKLSPRDYLSYKQDGAPVGNSDLKILNKLSSEYKLSNDLVNVLIYYGLKECNNVLSLNYLTKVAGSLKRMKLDNSIDALNYLEGNKSGSFKQKKIEKTPLPLPDDKIEEPSSSKDEELEEAIELMKRIK